MPAHSSDQSFGNLEANGIGIIDATRILAVLSDASIRIWDTTPGGDHGRVLDNSCSGLLLPKRTIHAWTGPPPVNAKGYLSSIDAITEGVSVDTRSNKAYIAIDSGLNEVDLTTLQVTAYNRYPEDVTVVSPASHPTPLTIGTSKALYLCDPRRRQSVRLHAIDDKEYMKNTTDAFNIRAAGPHCAPLTQPLPLSILHPSDDTLIHVAGRFPSILQFDRRWFPQAKSSVYSGARLSCLTSIPSASNTTTLAAAGEYNGKGSLEVYDFNKRTLGTNAVRNRTSASRSKCLSIASQGTRIWFSDGDGLIKCVERDAFTPVRQWDINSCASDTTSLPNVTLPGNGLFNTGSKNNGDVARRLVPMGDEPNSDISIWTGEKVGILSLATRRKAWSGQDHGVSIHESASHEERDYEYMMRRALEKQADEVRFLRDLGLASPL